jgi:hypothetical protein
MIRDKVWSSMKAKLLKMLFAGIVLIFSVSVGYSKVQQQLTTSVTASVGDNPSTYTLTSSASIGPSGTNLWTYTYKLTLKYKGTSKSIKGWRITLYVPSATPVLSGFTNCTCSYNDPGLGIVSTAKSGIMKPNSSVTFHIKFKLNTSGYTFKPYSVFFYT